MLLSALEKKLRKLKMEFGIRKIIHSKMLLTLLTMLMLLNGTIATLVNKQLILYLG